MLFWDYGMADLLTEEYAKYNIHYLTPQPYGEIGLVSKEKVETVDDLNGLKISTFGPWLDIVNDLGAVGTYIPGPDRYSALQTGVVDASLTTTAWMYDEHFYEVNPWLVRPGWLWGTTDQIIMNLDVWNSLPDDLQQILTATLKELAFAWASSRIIPAQNIVHDWQASGGYVSTLTDFDEKVVPAAVKMWDEVAKKDAASAEAVEIVKRFLRDMHYLK